ncbi:MAG: cell division protein FtsZ [Candidatus Lambdaproteobacteria bacterium]|nr:cell division protein FtsZ [Candidatus Lambdaproteobacteria bacterium]
MGPLPGGELKSYIPQIKVFGAGGAGGNVIAHMVRSQVGGVELVACNTDRQALMATGAPQMILLGEKTNRGRGSGANVKVGRACAIESQAELEQALGEAKMVFIAAGLGGGTGTGACPVIAELAKEHGALTVAVVTLPFSFEGKRRAASAQSGLAELMKHTDIALVIPNDKLVDLNTADVTLLKAFAMVDNVLVDVIQGITELITKVGLINVDFSDIRTIMENKGGGVIGRGIGRGTDRVMQAARRALHNPLMGDVDLRGAKGILVHIMGNEDLGILEIEQAMEMLTEETGDDVNLIFGATTNEGMGDTVSIMMIATGFKSPYLTAP